jgi:hypothetical protein
LGNADRSHGSSLVGLGGRANCGWPEAQSRTPSRSRKAGVGSRDMQYNGDPRVTPQCPHGPETIFIPFPGVWDVHGPGHGPRLLQVIHSIVVRLGRREPDLTASAKTCICWPVVRRGHDGVPVLLSAITTGTPGLDATASCSLWLRRCHVNLGGKRDNDRRGASEVLVIMAKSHRTVSLLQPRSRKA